MLSAAKKLTVAAAVAATAFGVAGVGSHFHQHHPDTRVTLAVDGGIHTLETSAKTVGALLAQQGVRVGAHDILAPAAGTALTDGTAITVRHAHELDLVVDGTTHEYWVTAATVGSALEQIGLRSPGAAVSASRSLPLGRQPLTVVVRTAKRVVVAHDGTRQVLRTTGRTVAQALGTASVALGADDTVRPGLASLVHDGETITVTRIAMTTQTKRVTLRHRTVRTTDSRLAKGLTRVATAGADGVRVDTYRVKTANGKQVSRKLVKSAVEREPVTAVIDVGTFVKPKPAPTPTRSSGGTAVPPRSGGGLNWGALAACESGGNPRAVNPAGFYGLYQFTLQTWHAMGGSGNPIYASAAEQTARAQALYRLDGSRPWPVCGARLFS